MDNLKKNNKKTFYKVSIGYMPVYFTNQEEAMELYRLLSQSVSRITIEEIMVDKFNGIDFGGYEYFHYVDRNKEITLGTEEKEIVSREEAEKIRQTRKTEKESFEAKKPKAKK